MTPDHLAGELRHHHPGMIVSVLDRGDRVSIAIYPPRRGHPQVNVRFEDGRVEWQGYWSETRWTTPFGHAIGLPGMNYVIPSKWGRACKTVVVGEGLDVRAGRLILTMTRRWFERHRPGVEGRRPPIPDGYRLATTEEIEASR